MGHIKTGIRLSGLVLIASFFIQFGFAQELTGQQVTIGKAHLEESMTPAEIEELEETNRVLDELKAFGKRLKRDDPERAAIANLYNRRIEQRNQKFAHLRGLNGQTVLGYGSPSPTASEIVVIVIRERLLGDGTGILYPHWERTRDGAVIGRTTAPRYDVVEGESFPAGDEVRAEIRFGEVPEATEDLIPDGPADGADCPFGLC